MSAQASACLCQRPIEPPKVFEPTVELLADAMRDQVNHCTEDTLKAAGFPVAFQREHGDKAAALANSAFVRTEIRSPQKSDAEIEAEAAGIIAELFPSTQRIIAELQARMIPARAIDRVLTKAKARAALSFCNRPMAGAH